MKENDLKQRLASYRQIKLSVIGRKSGRTIPSSNHDGAGHQFSVGWEAGTFVEEVFVGANRDMQLAATPLTDAKAVKSVTEKFREKYGAKDVKKYYSKFDVAVVVELV